MTNMMCSCCKAESLNFDVSGMRKIKDKGFIKYQLCKLCSAMLSNINPRVDSQKRLKLWDIIWDNAQITC